MDTPPNTSPRLCACGCELSESDHHVRFQWPDVAVAPETRPKVWMSAESEAVSNHMVLGDGEHFLVRSLLPLPLTDGHTLTYGAWFEVDRATFQRVLEEWWAPTYPGLTFVGRLANAIPGLNILDAECALAVVSPDAAPVVQSVAGNPRVLTAERPHREVLQRVGQA